MPSIGGEGGPKKSAWGTDSFKALTLLFIKNLLFLNSMNTGNMELI